jgi:signal transduction histidine kinase
VLEVTATWARWSKLAVLAVLLVVAAAVVMAYRAVGPDAAMMLLVAAAALIIASTITIARRRVQRVDQQWRLGEQALDALPQAVVVFDSLRPGGANAYVNAAYCQLTGYDASEALAPSFDALGIFVDSADIAALDGPAEVATTKRVTVRRRDGTTFAAKLALRTTPHGDSGRRYIVGLFDAIGAGERAADRGGPANPDPTLIGKDAEHARDAFLSWLSHELRSPLNACVMWLDVLALSPQPDKLTKAVETIKRNLARQARLVSDLNDAAKISRGGLELRAEPFDVVAVLKRGLDAWQMLAIGKQVAFHHDIEVESAPAYGDSERLFQAVNHLLESAIGSTAHGGRVDLRLRVLDGNCVIEVEDTGAPLSADDAANLAVPLWRGVESAKTRSGLGLGLAVAHHVAAKHGGSLSTASRAAGARFGLTLPLAASGRDAEGMARVDRTSSL